MRAKGALAEQRAALKEELDAVTHAECADGASDALGRRVYAACAGRSRRPRAGRQR